MRQRQLAAMTGDELDAEFWSHYDANNGTFPTTQPQSEIDTTRPYIPTEPETDASTSQRLETGQAI